METVDFRIIYTLSLSCSLVSCRRASCCAPGSTDDNSGFDPFVENDPFEHDPGSSDVGDLSRFVHCNLNNRSYTNKRNISNHIDSLVI